MWCIPTLTPEFIERMEDVLDLYAKPYNPREPVICFDEKSKQLLEDIKHPQQANKGKLRRRDYEYKRRGAVNIFLSVEPYAGYRSAIATKRRTKADFARELRRIIQLPRYQRAKTIHIVLDNLNTHNEQSLEETFGKQKTKKIMRHIRFHYTP